MNEKKLKELKTVLVLSLSLLLLHMFALKLYLYWTTWWMDIINHFLGGVVFAIISFIFWKNVLKKDVVDFFIVILSVLFIGILWEIFELYFGLTFVDAKGYVIDTILDIMMDITGGVCSYIYYIKNKF